MSAEVVAQDRATSRGKFVRRGQRPSERQAERKQAAEGRRFGVRPLGADRAARGCEGLRLGGPLRARLRKSEFGVNLDLFPTGRNPCHSAG